MIRAVEDKIRVMYKRHLRRGGGPCGRKWADKFLEQVGGCAVWDLNSEVPDGFSRILMGGSALYMDPAIDVPTEKTTNMIVLGWKPNKLP